MKYGIAILCLFISAASSADEQSVVLSVPGMKCPACPVTVMVAIERVEGVNSVNVELETRLAEVSYDDRLTTISEIQRATKNVGFPSHLTTRQKDPGSQ